MARRFIDQLLTQISKGWKPRDHINELILPTLSVVKAAGQIGVYGADNLRLVTTIKSDEGKTPVVTMMPTKADAYVLERHAVKALASDAEKENEEKPFNTERDKTELTMDILSVGREVALANFLRATANVTSNVTLTGDDQWSSSHADSDPIADVDLAVQTVADAMGVSDEMITLVFPLAVFRKLQRHTLVLDRLGFKYNQSVSISAEQMAAAFGVKKILIPHGIYNSAEDGQTDVIARIWGKDALALFIPERPELKQHCLGYTVRRKAGPVTDKWYDNDRAGTWVRTTDEFDQYIVNVAAAYLMKGAVA